MNTKIERRRIQRSRGQAIAEAGPAFLILILTFFPLIDFVYACSSYASCQYLFSSLLREAAVEVVARPSSSAPGAALQADLSCSTTANGSLNQMIQQWMQGAGGKFVSVTSAPTQQASFNAAEGSSTVQYVHLTMQVSCNPFLTLPFPLAVPGLNAPMPLTFTGRDVIECVLNY